MNRVEAAHAQEPPQPPQRLQVLDRVDLSLDRYWFDPSRDSVRREAIPITGICHDAKLVLCGERAKLVDEEGLDSHLTGDHEADAFHGLHAEARIALMTRCWSSRDMLLELGKQMPC